MKNHTYSAQQQRVSAAVTQFRERKFRAEPATPVSPETKWTTNDIGFFKMCGRRRGGGGGGC